MRSAGHWTVGQWIGAAAMALGVTLAPAAASAAPIAVAEYVETSLAGGLFQYDYTLSNATDPAAEPGVDLYDVLFFFPGDVELSALEAPSGWESNPVPPFVTSFLQLFSVLPGAADIVPGRSLAGFRFVVDAQVGALPFVVSFVNPADPGSPLVFDGETVAATVAAVPEPASLFLLASGATALAVRRRRR